jgi:hypothetical protein
LNDLSAFGDDRMDAASDLPGLSGHVAGIFQSARAERIRGSAGAFGGGAGGLFFVRVRLRGGAFLSFGVAYGFVDSESGLGCVSTYTKKEIK